ncbi:TPA: ABC transporter ATP-binding protein, partial [Clostridioides difficile]|nr:ABC transporter ATP-binding protein [Clostridioides difficile]
MITVDDLSFSYTDRDFLQNINFEVGKGEILGFL